MIFEGVGGWHTQRCDRRFDDVYTQEGHPIDTARAIVESIAAADTIHAPVKTATGQAYWITTCCHAGLSDWT